MQKIASFFAPLILCAGIASAEPAPDASLDQDLQIARSLTEANRQATVAANMKLTEAETKAFWPLYREYRTEQAKQSDRLIELIKTYAKEYDTLSDDQAKELTRTYLDIDKKRLGLKEKYLKKFEKVLPAAKVARAMQAEQKLDAIQAFGIARTVPLIPAR